MVEGKRFVGPTLHFFRNLWLTLLQGAVEGGRRCNAGATRACMRCRDRPARPSRPDSPHLAGPSLYTAAPLCRFPGRQPRSCPDHETCHVDACDCVRWRRTSNWPGPPTSPYPSGPKEVTTSRAKLIYAPGTVHSRQPSSHPPPTRTREPYPTGNLHQLPVIDSLARPCCDGARERACGPRGLPR